MPTPPLPVATCRLQLTPDFGFPHVRACLPYLVDLGISHLYLSPIFQARPGSTHGYDQTDPTRIRDALGGESAFRELAADARARRLGIILDIVPNHLAAHHDNPWWWRMLLEGPASDAARFFDVDWSAGNQRIILPCLGQSLPDALAAGEMIVEHAPSGPRLRYFDRLFPLRLHPAAAPPQPGPATPDLLSRQHYELAFWREGLARINYRRFFDIADLPGIRVEDPAVFHATHAALFRLAADGLINGVRIDHIDGLLDPHAYLHSLRRQLNHLSPNPILILIEKIFGPAESPPEDWPIDGTTGYEYLTAVTPLIAPPAAVTRIREHTAAACGLPLSFHVTALDCKRLAARDLLGSELNRLTTLLHSSFPTVDADALRDAIVELSAHLPVYRTYADHRALSPSDRHLIERAGEHAAHALPARAAILASLTALLLSDSPSATAREFRLRWQQFTGPLAAKGIEDTALYRDTLFLAFNEVGSHPQPAADPVAPLRAALDLRSRWPCSLNPGATHDTKRGEDARARLAVLALHPQRWLSLLESWSWARPDLPLAERLLVYQTLWGLWPDVRADADLSSQRIAQYLPKALREAKCRSSWSQPNPAAEAQLVDFAHALVHAPAADPFRRDLDALQVELAAAASAASLLSVLLRVLAPGIPDLYQGTEFPDLSLVDPDNRRPPDLAGHHRRLTALRQRWRTSPADLFRDLAADPACPDLKLFVYWRALQLRAWLLAPGAPLELRDLTLHSLPHGHLISWTAAAGPRHARVRCLLPPPHAGFSSPAPALPDDPSIDQLTGCPLSSPSKMSPLPHTVTLDELGVHCLA